MTILDKFKKNKDEKLKKEEPVQEAPKKEVNYEKAYNYLLNGVEALYYRGILQKLGLSDEQAKDIVETTKNYKVPNAPEGNDFKRKYNNLAAGTIRLYTNQIIQEYGIGDDDVLNIISEAGNFSKADLQHLQDSYLDGKNMNR